MTTPSELQAALVQYRAGLEAELVLLRRLEEVANRQKATSAREDMAALQLAADERETLMSGLLHIEQEIRPHRDLLSREKDVARQLAAFEEVAELHRTVTGIVKAILATDQDSIRALEQIVEAKRIAAKAAEHGEATLAAYGRVIAFPPSSQLVNRRG